MMASGRVDALWGRWEGDRERRVRHEDGRTEDTTKGHSATYVWKPRTKVRRSDVIRYSWPDMTSEQ